MSILAFLLVSVISGFAILTAALFVDLCKVSPFMLKYANVSNYDILAYIFAGNSGAKIGLIKQSDYKRKNALTL